MKQFDFGKKRSPIKKNPMCSVELEHYPYETLLKRLFDLQGETGHDTKNWVIPAPLIYKDGSKKVRWVNFSEICNIMNRPKEHIITYIIAELGTSGNIDGTDSLVLRNRFRQNQIETVLRNYIKQYVRCYSCKTVETSLIRDNSLMFMICYKCGCKRSVAPVKMGFHAITRGDRRQEIKNR